MDKFTIKAQEVVAEAQHIADENGHQEIGAEHLLLALLKQEEGLVSPVLQKIGVTPSTVQSQVETALSRMSKVHGVTGQVYISSALKTVLDKAWEEAQRLKDEYISTEHLLIAISESQSEAGNILRGAGASKDKIYKALMEVRGGARVSVDTGVHRRRR